MGSFASIPKEKKCINCFNTFFRKKDLGNKAWISQKFCSKICYTNWVNNHPEFKKEINLKRSLVMKKIIASGNFFKPEHRRKISESNKGKIISEEQRNRISKTLMGKSYITENGRKLLSLKLTGRKRTDEVKKRISETHSGSKHYRWNPNRNLVTRNADGRNDFKYRDWRIKVWKRDKFLCRIADKNCKGRIEAHHILGWSEHPELRYKINNGITLCHAHHPRKRAEEKRLSPYFKELVSVSKVQIGKNKW